MTLSTWTPMQDAFLRKHAVTHTCEWIGQRIHRSKSAVHARAKRLGVNMTKHGSAHWAARATAELADMIAALGDAGYRPVQIHALLASPPTLSRRAVEDICAGRTWRCPTTT